MCWMVYLGCDRALPTVASEALRVSRGDGVPESVRAILGTTFVYDLGSESGCACGFAYESEAELAADLESLADAPPEVREGARKDWLARRGSVDALRTYLETEVRAGPVMLFSAYYDDVDRPPSVTEDVTPSIIGGPSFAIRRKVLWRVSSGQVDSTGHAAGG